MNTERKWLNTTIWKNKNNKAVLPVQSLYLVPSSSRQYASSVHLTQGLVTKSVSRIEHCSKRLELNEMTSYGAGVILAQGLACSMHQSFPQSIALMKNGLELNLNL